MRQKPECIDHLPVKMYCRDQSVLIPTNIEHHGRSAACTADEIGAGINLANLSQASPSSRPQHENPRCQVFCRFRIFFGRITKELLLHNSHAYKKYAFQQWMSTSLRTPCRPGPRESAVF